MDEIADGWFVINYKNLGVGHISIPGRALVKFHPPRTLFYINKVSLLVTDHPNYQLLGFVRQLIVNKNEPSAGPGKIPYGWVSVSVWALVWVGWGELVDRDRL